MRDAGKHTFCLAMYPFAGSWQDAQVTQAAWSYNTPLIAATDRDQPTPCDVALKANGTMISTLKRSEEGESLIVRLYEYAGRDETVELTVPGNFKKASIVNLLERQAKPIAIDKNRVRIATRRKYIRQCISFGNR